MSTTSDTDSLLTLQDLYNEALVRELLEKTKNCGITWSYLGGNQFQAATTVNPGANQVVWTYYLSKTQIGSLSYRYNLDVKKNTDMYITIQDGPLSYSSRDSETKDLYEVVEIKTLGLDARIKETLGVVQGLAGCN